MNYLLGTNTGVGIALEMKYKNNYDTPVCDITGSPCTVYYTFKLINWKAFKELLPSTEIPKILTGYRSSDRQHFYSGNSILQVVDPIDRIRTPFEYHCSDFSETCPFNFVFTIGYSKRGLARKIKEYKINSLNNDVQIS